MQEKKVVHLQLTSDQLSTQFGQNFKKIGQSMKSMVRSTRGSAQLQLLAGQHTTQEVRTVTSKHLKGQLAPCESSKVSVTKNDHLFKLCQELTKLAHVRDKKRSLSQEGWIIQAIANDHPNGLAS